MKLIKTTAQIRIPIQHPIISKQTREFVIVVISQTYFARESNCSLMDYSYYNPKPPTDPRYGIVDDQYSSTDRHPPYQGQGPPRHYRPNQPPYQDAYYGQQTPSAGYRGRSQGSSVSNFPQPSEEDRSMIQQVKSRMSFTHTLPTMAGTWFSIYVMNRYIAPAYGQRFRISTIGSVTLSFLAYGYCIYKKGKEAVLTIANQSRSPYGDAVREYCKDQNNRVLK